MKTVSKFIIASALFASALFASANMLMAQEMNHDIHKGHKMGDKSASSMAFTAANDKMHKDMMVELTGDTDVDFVKGMMPHHQGAIDMAKIELQYGKDVETRKLATEIIKAQEIEIAQMKAWLLAHKK